MSTRIVTQYAVINTAAVVNPEKALVSEIASSAPVMKELSANAPVPRAKKRGVVKKTPMSEPILVNADKSVGGNATFLLNIPPSPLEKALQRNL